MARCSPRRRRLRARPAAALSAPAAGRRGPVPRRPPTGDWCAGRCASRSPSPWRRAAAPGRRDVSRRVPAGVHVARAPRPVHGDPRPVDGLAPATRPERRGRRYAGGQAGIEDHPAGGVVLGEVAGVAPADERPPAVERLHAAQGRRQHLRVVEVLAHERRRPARWSSESTSPRDWLAWLGGPDSLSKIVIRPSPCGMTWCWKAKCAPSACSKSLRLPPSDHIIRPLRRWTL